MKRLISVVVLFVVMTGCASQMEREHETGALNATEAWLDLLDKDDTENLWAVTSQIAKDRYEKEFYLKYLQGKRKMLGKVINRDLQYNWTLELFQGSLPDGTHRRIMYWTEYENRELAKELIIITLEEGQWKVVEWQLK